MTETDSRPPICIAAAVISRADGQVLLVRKRGSQAFMQPGGKIDAGETPLQALCRELQEELQISVPPDGPIYLGRYAAAAVNEPGFTVIAEAFHLTWASAVTPSAEIEEARWIDPAHLASITLAPLSRDHILPAWKAV
ncbi:NUDIX domain-containing protein [Silvimonas sp. JCM 19000]